MIDFCLSNKPPDHCDIRRVLVCQNISCRKQHSAEVLAAFKQACQATAQATAQAPVLFTEPSSASKDVAIAAPNLRNQTIVDGAVEISSGSSSDSSRDISGDSSRDISAQISGDIPTNGSDPTFSKISIEPSGCLGQCGNGPMVLVLPDQVWYCRVQPEEVAAVVERHLRHGHPIQTMRYYPV